MDYIYFDNNATTPVDDRVLKAMLPYFAEDYANASSSHSFGIKIKNSVDAARSSVANLISAKPSEIVFTSGATEAINLAIKGLALNPLNSKRHIVTVQTEHKAVLESCEFLESLGFEITYLPVSSDGVLDINELKKSIRLDTLLVSIMYVNNETGVIQPIREIGRIVRTAGSLFMTDATQAVGRIPVNVDNDFVDLMSFSAHKFYGPKGIGALYINATSIPKGKIIPFLHGGGHENGMRSGTVNVAGIVGFGKACEISSDEMRNDQYRIRQLRDRLEASLLSIGGACLNGSQGSRIYNTLNVFIPGINVDVLIGRNKNIAVSNGSACTSATLEPSHVLKSMGVSAAQAYSSIRISLGRFNNEMDVNRFLEILRPSFHHIKS